jgi:hypothetical protein
MRVRSFFALAAVAAMTAAGFGGVGSGLPAASAATSVSLTVADMDTFDAGSPFPKVICIDDTAIPSEAGDVHPPITVTPGEHHLTVYGTAGPQVCNTEGNVNLDATITIGEAPNQTLLVYWGSGTGQQASVLVDDLSCPPTGTGRVVYRPGAAVTEDANTSLGYSDFVPWVEDVEVGHQGAANVAAGTYAQWAAVLTEAGSQVVDGPDSSAVAAGGTIFVYTLGGNDGDRAMIVMPEIACTPVIPLTPLTPAPVAQPLVVTPLFTG